MLIRICGVSITKGLNNQTVKKYTKKKKKSIFPFLKSFITVVRRKGMEPDRLLIALRALGETKGSAFGLNSYNLFKLK